MTHTPSQAPAKMFGYDFTLAGARLTALPQRALWWAQQSLLCVSDLHLGKSERHLRRGGSPLPPYEGEDTLSRLEVLITALQPDTVICLGDSFDDTAAAQVLPVEQKDRISQLVQRSNWIWIEGNHDPQPNGFGGRYLAELARDGICFRHIAAPDFCAAPRIEKRTSRQETAQLQAEISGHYHPKAGLRGINRPAFLLDQQRLILPAFGTYTGGLHSRDPALSTLMHPQALAILTGPRTLAMPMPRRRR